MAWIELIARRNRTSRVYQQDTQEQWCSTLAPLHYESTLDSGIHDATIDTTPVRVNNAAFDGWLVTANSWHYALGKPKSGALSGLDGVVGFGGRKGQNWVRFRLARIGYIHWPTRAWQDVGGVPTYTRANLSSETHAAAIGPNGDAVNVESVATWTNIWTTPGSGNVSARWCVTGDQLKEEIIINQAAREWVAANHPPTTPASETWFSLVFRVDWSDIPRVVRAGILQNLDSDFADDGEGIHLQDASERLLAFMPLDYVYAGTHASHSDSLPERQPLRKRFWKDVDDNWYVLVGVRCDVLAAMVSGPLRFDPTFNQTIGVSDNDAFEPTTGLPELTLNYDQVGDVSGESVTAIWRYTNVTIAQGATITGGTITLTGYDAYTGPVTMFAYFGCEDVDDSAVPTTTDNNISSRAANITTDRTDQDIHIVTADATYAITITSAVQEVISRVGWASGNDLAVLCIDHSCPSGENQTYYDYTGSAAKAAVLDITYTAGGVTHNGEAVLTGLGTVAPNAQKTAMGLAALAGAGTLASNAQNTAMGLVSLIGIGTFASNAQRIATGMAALAGTGILAADAYRTILAATELLGTGSLLSDAQKTALANTILSGIGTLLADGSIVGVQSGAAILAAIGSLSADAQLSAFARTILSGTGTLSADAQRTALAEAILAGIGTLLADGSTSGALEGAAILAAIGALSATAQLTVSGAAKLEGKGTLSSLAHLILVALSELLGRGTIAADGTVSTSVIFYDSGTRNILEALARGIRRATVRTTLEPDVRQSHRADG